jgi:hypothetical protein
VQGAVEEQGGGGHAAEHGDFAASWKPLRNRARVTAFAQGVLDLILPPRAFDGGAALSGGLSADAWSRITFLDGPVCDGCGAPFEYDAGEIRCAAVPGQAPRLRPGPRRLPL